MASFCLGDSLRKEDSLSSLWHFQASQGQWGGSRISVSWEWEKFPKYTWNPLSSGPSVRVPKKFSQMVNNSFLGPIIAILQWYLHLQWYLSHSGDLNTIKQSLCPSRRFCWGDKTCNLVLPVLLIQVKHFLMSFRRLLTSISLFELGGKTSLLLPKIFCQIPLTFYGVMQTITDTITEHCRSITSTLSPWKFTNWESFGQGVGHCAEEWVDLEDTHAISTV